MPVLDVLWSMLWLFLFFAWVWVVVAVLGDVFRSDDLGGWAKALWTLLIILVPWLGVVIYLIARGDSMSRRYDQAALDQEMATRSYIRNVAGSSDADELSKLAQLRDTGVISTTDFETQKEKILSRAS